jgi:hypothetical protein
VASPTHNSIDQELGAITHKLHLSVVVGLNGKHLRASIAKECKQFIAQSAKIGGPSNDSITASNDVRHASVHIMRGQGRAHVRFTPKGEYIIEGRDPIAGNA